VVFREQMMVVMMKMKKMMMVMVTIVKMFLLFILDDGWEALLSQCRKLSSSSKTRSRILRGQSRQP
jgi:hypothetical protein